MDEIFGRQRFVACNVWRKRCSRGTRGAIGDVHEYLVVYAVYAMNPDEVRKEVPSIFGTRTAFDTPKPTRLIQRVVQIATNPGDPVLDSVAGSGTTGHAVLKRNAEDDGNRRFVLEEMDENIALRHRF